MASAQCRPRGGNSGNAVEESVARRDRSLPALPEAFAGKDFRHASQVRRRKSRLAGAVQFLKLVKILFPFSVFDAALLPPGLPYRKSPILFEAGAAITYNLKFVY